MIKVNPKLITILYRLSLLTAVCLTVYLRLIYPQSDAYSRLTWSSALITDEGFYMHNARNYVLYGHMITDHFNNMLIMPALNYLQIIVFRIWGVGVVQTRDISIVCSLITLVILWDGLKRLYNTDIAWLGTLMLGLGHAYLLYNRLGLMDTPGSLVLTLAWWTWVKFDNSEAEGYHWLFMLGVVLGCIYWVRGLGALIWPVPFLLIYFQRDRDNTRKTKRQLLWLAAGLLIPIAAYLMLWWIPYHTQLAEANRYYIGYQLVPHSIGRLFENIAISCFVWERGELPYLLKHMPVETSLTLGWLFLVIQRKNIVHKIDSSSDYCLYWAGIFFLFMSVVNYAPSRYFVLYYPALCILSASMLHLLNQSTAAPIFKRSVIFGSAALWLMVNIYWYQDWLGHITYRQIALSRWLGSHLPPNAVVFGDLAPGFCMSNKLRCVNVMHGLCNYRNTFWEAHGRPSYILILDGRWKEGWWVKQYPQLVTSKFRVSEFNHILRKSFVLGLYRVPSSVVNAAKYIK